MNYTEDLDDLLFDDSFIEDLFIADAVEGSPEEWIKETFPPFNFKIKGNINTSWPKDPSGSIRCGRTGKLSLHFDVWSYWPDANGRSTGPNGRIAKVEPIFKYNALHDVWVLDGGYGDLENEKVFEVFFGKSISFKNPHVGDGARNNKYLSSYDIFEMYKHLYNVAIGISGSRKPLMEDSNPFSPASGSSSTSDEGISEIFPDVEDQAQPKSSGAIQLPEPIISNRQNVNANWDVVRKSRQDVFKSWNIKVVKNVNDYFVKGSWYPAGGIKFEWCFPGNSKDGKGFHHDVDYGYVGFRLLPDTTWFCGSQQAWFTPEQKKHLDRLVGYKMPFKPFGVYTDYEMFEIYCLFMAWAQNLAGKTNGILPTNPYQDKGPIPYDPEKASIIRVWMNSGGKFPTLLISDILFRDKSRKLIRIPGRNYTEFDPAHYETEYQSIGYITPENILILSLYIEHIIDFDLHINVDNGLVEKSSYGYRKSLHYDTLFDRPMPVTGTVMNSNTVNEWIERFKGCKEIARANGWYHDETQVIDVDNRDPNTPANEDALTEEEEDLFLQSKDRYSDPKNYLEEGTDDPIKTVIDSLQDARLQDDQMNSGSIIDALITALASEYEAWYSYISVLDFITGPLSKEVDGLAEDYGSEELDDHAAKLRKRIADLGGSIVDLNAPSGWLDYLQGDQIAQPITDPDVHKVLYVFVKNEEAAIKIYRNLINLAEEVRDGETKALAEEILGDEEKHLVGLNDVIARLGGKPYKPQLTNELDDLYGSEEDLEDLNDSLQDDSLLDDSLLLEYE